MRALSELLTVKDVMAQSGLTHMAVLKAVKRDDLRYAYRDYKGSYYFEPDVVAAFAEKFKVNTDLISRTEAKAIMGVSTDLKFDSLIQSIEGVACGDKMYSKKVLEDYMEKAIGIKSAQEIKENYYSLREVSIIFNEDAGHLRSKVYSGDIVADVQLLSHQYFFSRETVEGIAGVINKTPNWEAVPNKIQGVL